MKTIAQPGVLVASLDFEGRSVLILSEIAQRLGCSVEHLCNEIECGSLVGIDLKGAKATRRSIRVPIECYRAYVIARMTAPFFREYVLQLPKSVQEEMWRILNDSRRKEELERRQN